jgi:hypothetical protein
MKHLVQFMEEASLITEREMVDLKKIKRLGKEFMRHPKLVKFYQDKMSIINSSKKVMLKFYKQFPFLGELEYGHTGREVDVLNAYIRKKLASSPKGAYA